MEQLAILYKEYTGQEPVATEPLHAAGSNRQYYRLRGADGTTLIGAVGTSREENAAFCHLARHFALKGLPVPAVVAESTDGLRYLQTDLGDRSLFDALRAGREAGGRYSTHERELLHRTIALLPDVQMRGAEGLDFRHCYPQEAMDETNVHFDLNYFKYCFLKATGIDFHELRLEADFRQLAADITAIPGGAFMYRDFQARNVLLVGDDEPRFIDFQGGRRGPVQYDVASFLYQASARYDSQLREELLQTYMQSLRRYTQVDEAQFRRHLRLCVLFRLLQVLGAYGFRGYFERKRHFIDSIPPAMQNVKELLEAGGCPYPYLREVLMQLVAHFAATPATEQGQAKSAVETEEPTALVVRVTSFSYKRGIPADTSGNGGGYVFDCRSTHNPGRYEPYKKLTGLDEPVIRFLEDDGEITTFLESVYRLTDAHVKRYLERGFTSLMLSFGCTGGQHRSVYCAQHVAERLSQRFGVEVRLCHREQGITQTFAPRRCMIFAAGLGTRLKPLTDTMPKALVPVAGKPLLQHQLERLRRVGCYDVVINVHHFADQIEEWCRSHPQGMNIRFSDERQQLLETGGGVKHARRLLQTATDGFLIHNVDILSNADLQGLTAYGRERGVALLVSTRRTDRYLLWDDDMRLVGWTNTKTGEVRSPYASQLDPSRYHRYAFAGVHYMSPALFPHFDAWGERFSVIDFYLSLCHRVPIYGYLQPDLRLMDVGKTDTLAEAEAFLHTLHEEEEG